MTIKEICLNNKAIAYYSGCGGVEVHHIEYGLNDYIYCVSGAWCGNKKYHKLKINYDENGNPFIILKGYKMPLNEFIRI